MGIQNIFVKLFADRNSHTETAGSEQNFQPAMDIVLRKTAYDVSKQIRMRLDPCEDA